MITGVTSHKLDLVSTYDQNNVFQVGVNGVTAIVAGNPMIIKYTIDGINYETKYQPTKSGFDVSNFTHPTTFNTNLSGFDFAKYFFIKEEAKMGLVFPPKVNNELFIERMSLAVFERHSRLSDIKTLEMLINYRNGYYKIIDNK
jgi:hypothetical protein